MVSEQFRKGMGAVMVTCLLVVIGGLFLGRLDVVAAGVLALLVTAWILGYLDEHPGESDTE